MSKKKKIRSLSIDPELSNRLDQYAEKKASVWGDDKANASKCVCDLLEKYMVIDDNIIPVILKIPANLKGSDLLKDWLAVKSDAIAKALSS